MKILLQSFSFLHNNGNYNLALLFLKSTLLDRPERAAALQVELLQSDYFDDVDAVFDRIVAYDPDVLGFSVFIWSKELTGRLLRRLEERGRRPLIVCGGTGLIAVERDFMEAHPTVDVVVRGAGEATFTELVEHYLNRPEAPRALDAIAGLTYRDAAGQLRETPDRLHNLPLAQVPSPYRNGHYVPPGSNFILETERYCPFRCSYCTWTAQSRHHTDLQFPIEEVAADLRWAKARGCTEVTFYDSSINYRSDRFIALLDVIRGLDEPSDNISYFFFLKFEFINREQIRRLAAVGKPCLVFLGVETFSPDALRVARRPNRLERVFPLLDALSRVQNVRLMVGLILGLPGDNVQHFLAGLDRLARYPQVHTIVSTLSVAPGTDILREADRHGLVFRRSGVPLLLHSNDFPPADFQAALAGIDRHIAAGRASLNPIHLPFGRLANPEILPDAVRARLGPADWLRVGVLGIDNGYVEGSGFYPQELGVVK